MFTKQYLLDNKNGENEVTLFFFVNWQETNLSRLYDVLDLQVEGGALADIVSAEPVSLDPEKQVLQLKVVINVADIFNIPDKEVEDCEG
jgi:hypothetical protein